MVTKLLYWLLIFYQIKLSGLVCVQMNITHNELQQQVSCAFHESITTDKGRQSITPQQYKYHIWAGQMQA
jgi:hypothetical protein